MTTVISVRFRSGPKTYFFDPGELTVAAGQDVIVETSQGLEFAQCAEGNHGVDDQLVVQPLRPVVRLATEADRRIDSHNRSREKDAFEVCQKKILEHQLEMKLVRVECSFEGNKILFFFTADGRVDFRELVKDLAGIFRARIELRQIGVRDEAKMLGGLGICGRPFCCSQFMDAFVPVSIKMAKTQNLSLNPTKISGTCGRLMCCLKYEQDAYEDALKRLPKNDSFVQTPDGVGNVSDVNVLKETVTVRLDQQPESPRCYHNCEICVLRNGKGSRDGIVIPSKRPERYVEEKPEEEIPLPAIISDFHVEPLSEIPSVEEEQQEGGQRRRRRSRGRRGGQKTAGETAAAEVRTTRKEDAPAAVSEVGKDEARSEGGQRRRRRSRGRKPAGEQAVPQPKQIPRTDAPKAEGGEGQAKKPRHRGGRRRHRGGSCHGESSKPQA
ncbi:MAG: hypothetical protein E7457_05245 [Ruminococcaceae bacterium]|nr:hypothetical protein [Oscillospiraceae bacterium]